MESLAILNLCLMFLFNGLLIVQVGNEYMRQKAQRNYEVEFLNRHRDTIHRLRGNDFLPLTFPHQETEHLLKICKQYRSAFMNRLFPISSQPSRQIHYIGFRRQKTLHNPVRIEVIRCSDMIAIIEAGDGAWGYVLKRYLPLEHMSLGFTLFNIHGKFKYRIEDLLVAEMQPLMPDLDGGRRENQAPEIDPGLAPRREADLPHQD